MVPLLLLLLVTDNHTLHSWLLQLMSSTAIGRVHALHPSEL